MVRQMNLEKSKIAKDQKFLMESDDNSPNYPMLSPTYAALFAFSIESYKTLGQETFSSLDHLARNF